MPRRLTYLLPIILLATLAGAVRAAEDKLVTVTVSCDRADLVKGLKLRVLTRDAMRGGLVQTGEEPTLDESGKAAVPLPLGIYVFEILHATHDGTLFSLQSASVDNSRTKAATIAVIEPAPVTLKHDGRQMTIREVAVRSAAVRTEARWTRSSDAQTPRISVSRKSECMVNVHATLGPVHAAAWLRPDPSDGVAFSTRQDWNICRFARREKSPAASDVTARIGFPDSKMEVTVTPEARLITNRRFFMVGYTVAQHDGPTMKFRPIGNNVTRSQRFEFGGDLTPHAWAGYVWEDTGNGWRAHFDWRAGLVDSDGRNVDIYAKTSGVKWSLARLDGKPVPKGVVEEPERRELGELTETLKATIDWQWDKPMTQTVAPEGFVELGSARVRIEIVPFWTWEAQNYLSKIERYHQVERAATGRPGPASINIDWRANTHNAKSIVGGAKGGGHWLWMSLPFRGYEDNHDPFSEPWFVGHEMLHTFGYHHGDEMSRLQKLVEANFADHKWRMVDKPTTELPIEQGALVPKATKKR
ncbi:MAG: hypothetical protein QOF78_3651 [Phycisphaerales bacterium]|nr:hypothetical protein [Phycisphaerales bacterium]